MIQQEQIPLKAARDFGETFNASTKFIRQNFLSYLTCILLLAGPFILLYSISYAYYSSVVEYKQSLVKAGRLYNISKFGWEYFLALFFQGISYLSMSCTTYAYMVVYNEKGRNNFSAGDVMRKMNAVLGKIFGAFFLFGFLSLIFVVAVGFIVAMLIETAPVIGVLLVLILIFAVLILAPNILWQLSTVFLVIISEEEIPLSAYGRTREVMKDNYWWTWLIVVCSSLMILFMSLLFMIPELVYAIVVNLSSGDEPEGASMLSVIIYTLCTFCASIIYSMNYVVGGFHYFSLSEKKDGDGLMQRINEIGKTTAPISNEQQF
jgi:hypothetical protein